MVAYAAMSVIPILSFGYFLLSCFVPGTATREGVLTIVILITLLSLAGFIALHNKFFECFSGNDAREIAG